MPAGGHLARLAATWLPRAAWAAVVAGATTAAHQARWGFDLASPTHWSQAWRAFLSGGLVIDTLDEIVQWGSLPAAAAIAILGGYAAPRRAQRLVAWVSNPIRDDTPLDSDYDPAVIAAPLPGARAAAAASSLKTLKQAHLDDQSITDEADAEVRRFKQEVEGTVDQAYAPAPTAPSPAAVPPAQAAPTAEAPAAPFSASGAPSLEADEATVLRLYGVLAQIGWSAAVLRGVPVASALRPDDRVDFLLAGDSRIYPVVTVALPQAAAALPFEARGVWQLERGAQRWDIPSPVVRAITLANAVDEALQRAGVFDGPFVVPCIVLTSGVLRCDRDHDALWDAHDVVMMSEPPGRMTATNRMRNLASVLGADRPSGAVLTQLREALDA